MREVAREHDASSSLPAYMRIQQYVMGVARDANGRCEKLMSIKELCATFQVSHMTVRKALATLIAEGRLISRQGLGVFVNPGYTALPDPRCRSDLTVGVITGTGMLIHHDHLYSRVLAAAMETLAEELAIIRFIHLAGTGEAAVNEIRALAPRGILWLFPGAAQTDIIQALDAEGLPVVAVDHGKTKGPGNRMSIPLFDGGYAAAKHLLELGHRKILFAGDSLTLPVTKLMLDGFKKAHADFNVSFDPRLVVMKDEALPTKIKMLLDMGFDFSAAFSESGEYVLLRETLETLGKNIPRDVSLMTEEDSGTLWFIKQSGDNPTRVARPLPELGKTAAETLLKLIKKEIAPPARKTFAWRIEPGVTCRKWEVPAVADNGQRTNAEKPYETVDA